MKRTDIIIAVAIVALCATMVPQRVTAQAARTGSPEDNLPPNITRLTGFGERAVWSPDGKRIAFMSKSFGDAFEIDLATRMTRLLTGHFRHAGFLRVHYLPNGDYFLIGARTFTDIRTTRDRDQEMWIMKASPRSAPIPLGHRISEGVAISRKRMRIAWANTRGQYPDSLAEGESVIYMADVVYDSAGTPKLANVKELIRAKRPACTLEAQDFRRDDTELVYVCYRERDKADVFGLDLATGKSTTYLAVEGEYNEVEGVEPGGAWALVESSREQGADRQDSRHIDLWKLTLVPNSTQYVRMTRWGDWDGYKASNPTVSPDGNWFAFQSARSVDPAGVGYGIFLYRLR